MSIIDDLSYDQAQLIADRVHLKKLQEQRIEIEKQHRAYDAARAAAPSARARAEATQRRRELGMAISRLDSEICTLKRSIKTRTQQEMMRGELTPDCERMRILLQGFQKMAKQFVKEGHKLTPHQQQIIDDTAVVLGQKTLLQLTAPASSSRRIEPRFRKDIDYVLTGNTRS
jgi:hypothetical protein